MLPVLLVVVIPSAFLILLIFFKFIWFPLRIQRYFQKQGITGPPYRLFSGNTVDIRRLYGEALKKKALFLQQHDIVPRIIPFYDQWSDAYGTPFLYWFGCKPRLAISNPEMIKALLVSRSVKKIEFNAQSRELFGQGLVGLQGRKWALHRQIIHHLFRPDMVKGFVPPIVDSTKSMLKKWNKLHEDKVEFEMDAHKELHILAADIISKIAFGSNYEEGKLVFALQEQQIPLISLALRSIYIPGFRFIPTKNNRDRWKLEKRIREVVKKLIENYHKSSGTSINLLYLLLSPFKDQDGKEKRLGEDEVVDECKTFYFAGKDTTANLLTWILLLLALNQEWQTKAREEVIRVFDKKEFTLVEINNLKIVALIIKETLRLYPPAVMFLRETSQEISLGTLIIPTGTQLLLPFLVSHYDCSIWGEDANEFNPARFIESKKPFFPFGLGQRTCIGEDLAVLEAKIILAMILEKYTFVVSPTYVHAPVLQLTLQPQHGTQIIFSKILT